MGDSETPISSQRPKGPRSLIPSKETVKSWTPTAVASLIATVIASSIPLVHAWRDADRAECQKAVERLEVELAVSREQLHHLAERVRPLEKRADAE